MKQNLMSLLVSTVLFTAIRTNAGMMDVGLVSARKTVLSEDVSTLISLNTTYKGRILRKAKKGELLTNAKCSVVANSENGILVVEIVNISLLEKGAEYSFAVTLFEAKENGSELLVEPSYLNPDGSGIELSIINKNKVALKVQNLVIRSHEGGAVVSVSEKSDSDFDVPASEISCVLHDSY